MSPMKSSFTRPTVRKRRLTVEWKRITKHQIPNTKLQRNHEIETPKTKLQTPKKSQVPSSKPRPALRAWNLELGASLVFGVWCLVFELAQHASRIGCLRSHRNRLAQGIDRP